MKTIAVTGADLSTAWLAACRAMSGTAPVAYHTVVRIENPAAEDRSDPLRRGRDPRRRGPAAGRNRRQHHLPRRDRGHQP